MIAYERCSRSQDPRIRSDVGEAALTGRAADTLLFLPGASGNTAFWRPVAERLRHPGKRAFVAWPGFGGVPSEPDVNGVADLVDRLLGSISGPVDLLAQSMGGVIAIRAALERPDLVRHLVLAVTSGGLDVSCPGLASDVSDRASRRATMVRG
jgi:pimeloyl-ACP methyl ester carboxylesterase